MIANAPRIHESATTHGVTNSPVEWTIHRHQRLLSTNPVAGKLGAWNAVIANEQSAGYGRTGRIWTSGAGGLWMSAVLPAPQDPIACATLPLSVGCTLGNVLSGYGVQGLRVRWPNDLLVGKQKLAGVLLERHTPATVVVGIGLNVLNDPASLDRSLGGQTVNLSQLWNYPRSLFEISYDVLAALADMHHRLSVEGFKPYAQELRQRWSMPGRVEIHRAGDQPTIRGNYEAVDDHGRLLLSTDDGQVSSYDAAHVTLLREIS